MTPRAQKLVENAVLTRQSYGIASAQNTFGGPRGIWLECTACPLSQVIVGSSSEAWDEVPTEESAAVFKRHGWTGNGPMLLKAKCPECSRPECFGSNPGSQAFAENDCERCPVAHACLDI